MKLRDAVFPRNDFLRVPVLACARPDGFKEWHHYLLQSPDLRLLINFSVTGTSGSGAASRLLPRVIVIAHDKRWSGAVEQFAEQDLDISPDMCGMAIGANRMLVTLDGYQVAVDLPDRDIACELRFTVTGAPSITRVNNQPVGAGRISWLFVPRLRADGWVALSGRRQLVERCPAYHDHNWGHFQWGDDFGWEWGSILPTAGDDPWSLVFTRKTDRRRLRCLSQALYLWHHDELAAMFRDGTIQMRAVGRLGSRPDCTLPPVMRLLAGGESSDVPASIEITAASSAGSLRAVFRPGSYARLVQPSELVLDRAVVLSEVGGTAQIDGSVNGRAFDATGTGVYEMLHG